MQTQYEMQSSLQITIIAAAFSGNKGAAAMLQSIIKNLSSLVANVKFDILSVYPDEDIHQNKHDNVDIISCRPEEIIFIAFPLAILYYVFKWFGPLKRVLLRYPILKSFSEADLVVDAAGISFVDSRGFIMNTYNFICMVTPLLLGKRIVKFSQALGPFNRPWNRLLAKLVLPRLYKICARGEITKAYLKELHLTNINLCADGAFVMPDDINAAESVKKICEKDSFYSEQVICISISSVVEKNCDKVKIDYKTIMCDFINYLIDKKGYNVLIIANAAREGKTKWRNNDLIVCNKIYKQISNKEKCRWYNKEFTAEEIREFISLSKLLIASRFHAMIGSLYKGVPVLLIGWSHKYKEVLDMFKLGHNAIDYKELSLEKIISEFDNLERQEETIRKSIRENLPSVKQSAMKNFEVILKALQMEM